MSADEITNQPTAYKIATNAYHTVFSFGTKKINTSICRHWQQQDSTTKFTALYNAQVKATYMNYFISS